MSYLQDKPDQPDLTFETLTKFHRKYKRKLIERRIQSESDQEVPQLTNELSNS